MPKKIIAASILSADFAHLAEDVQRALDAGVEYIHFDVMDHHFVPNLSFGACICSALRKAGIRAPIDVHLMVTDPLLYIEPFRKAGANLLTFHPETTPSVDLVVHEIKKAGLQAGLAFNPDRPVELSETLASQLDMILLMSVFPGFGGQMFIPSVLEKAQKTKQRLQEINSHALLAIDGGINLDTITAASEAGIDYFVIGSGLFAAPDYAIRVQALKKKCRSDNGSDK